MRLPTIVTTICTVKKGSLNLLFGQLNHTTSAIPAIGWIVGLPEWGVYRAVLLMLCPGVVLFHGAIHQIGGSFAVGSGGNFENMKSASRIGVSPDFRLSITRAKFRIWKKWSQQSFALCMAFFAGGFPGRQAAVTFYTDDNAGSFK